MGWNKISEIDSKKHFPEPENEVQETIQRLILYGRGLDNQPEEYRKGWVYALDHLATELYGRKDD